MTMRKTHLSTPFPSLSFSLGSHLSVSIPIPVPSDLDDPFQSEASKPQDKTRTVDDMKTGERARERDKGGREQDSRLLIKTTRLENKTKVAQATPSGRLR